MSETDLLVAATAPPRRRKSPSPLSYAKNRLTTPAFSQTVETNDPKENGRKAAQKLRSQSTTDLPKFFNNAVKATEGFVSELLLPGAVQLTPSPSSVGSNSPGRIDEEFAFEEQEGLEFRSKPRTDQIERQSSINPSSSSSESETEDIDIPICDNKNHAGRELVNVEVECSVEQLFTLLFTGSKFFNEFHHYVRGTKNLEQSAWAEDKITGEQNRKVCATLKLNNRLGPSTADMTEKQVLLSHSKKKILYAINMETSNAGIPYADTFYVAVHFCLSRLTKKTSKLVIYGQVRYWKSTLMKTFIEKQTYNGLDEFYKCLANAVQEEARRNPDFIIPCSSSEPLPVQEPKIGKVGPIAKPRAKRPAPPPPPFPAKNTIQQNSNLLSSFFSSVSSISSDSNFLLRFIFILLIGLSIFHLYLFLKLLQLETMANETSSNYYCGKLPPSEQWANLVLKQTHEHEKHLKDWYEILAPTLKYLQGLDIITKAK